MLGARLPVHPVAELWRHPWFERWAEDDLDAYVEFLRDTPLRAGIECDFIPGAEDRTASMLEARDFDYVVGSVHFVGRHAVDTEEFGIWDLDGDPDRIWRRYFEMTAELARSGSSTSSPTRTWSRSGAGRACFRNATRASTTSPPSRRSPKRGSRSRSRPPASR